MLPSLRSVLIACSPLLLLACGKLEGETGSAAGVPPGVATGNVQVMLAVTGTNLDNDDAEAVGGVNVTISEVTLFPAEGGDGMPAVGSIGPVSLLGGPVTFNLLALAGNPVTLVSGPVPAVTYERLRVAVSGASVSLMNGATNTLEVENGTVERGIDVQVDEGQTTTVTVTINVRESVNLNRNNRGSFRPALNVSD